jgi:hypothetical protein
LEQQKNRLDICSSKTNEKQTGAVSFDVNSSESLRHVQTEDYAANRALRFYLRWPWDAMGNVCTGWLAGNSGAMGIIPY